jgi:glycosyltransferase involved in cell wall biosynthesis
MNTTRKLTIVIPCYNEAQSLVTLLNNAIEISKNHHIDFVFVDNGSTDNTRNIFKSKESTGIRYVYLDKNEGYGAGIKAGLRFAETDFVGWTHADLQTPLIDLTVPLNQCNGKKLFIKGKRVGRKKSDKLFSLGMGFMESLLFGTKLREINAQPTIFHRSLMKNWNPPDDFAIDLYTYLLAKRKNWREIRFDVIFNKRLYGTSKWNYGIRARFKFIARTLEYSFKLRSHL